MNRSPPLRLPLPSPALDPELAVLQAIRDTSFGTVEVTVHQSRIVQITRTEKVRFEPARPEPARPEPAQPEPARPRSR
jgi:hypothetical protein